MKNSLMLFLAMILIPAMSFAWTKEFSGLFHDSGLPNDFGYFQKVPAKLRITFSGNQATAKLVAPGARCIPKFGSADYIGKSGFLLEGGVLRIDFPILRSCSERTRAYVNVHMDQTGKIPTEVGLYSIARRKGSLTLFIGE